MANEFIARKGLIVSGSTQITGSLNVTAGITGSLLGTGSWAQNVVSASYAQTASIGLVAKAVDIIAGSIGSAQTSYTGSFSGSFTGSVTSASYALTASYVAGAASTWDDIANKPIGILSSSTQINALSNVSASFATTASAATSITFTPSSASFATTASFVELAASSSTPFAITGSTLFSNTITRQVSPTSSVFIGNDAGFQANLARNSVFVGNLAGYQMSASDGSSVNGFNVAIGDGAGYRTTGSQMVLIGNDAGRRFTDGVSNMYRTVAIGNSAGYDVQNGTNAVFIGHRAGYQLSGSVATVNDRAIAIGRDALYRAQQANYGVYIGGDAGYQGTAAGSSVVIGYRAGYFASQSSGVMIGNSAGGYVANMDNLVLVGINAGYLATGSTSLTAIGHDAGRQASSSRESVFVGHQTAYQVASSSRSQFIGVNAGYRTSGSNNSTFIGYQAGRQASQSYASIFIGDEAGYFASQSNDSNFIGYQAGYLSAGVQRANFIGYQAGERAYSGSYSTLIGYNAGFNTSSVLTGIGSNNIIIGTNITLPQGTSNAINFGNIIYATGSYSTVTGNPSAVPVATGRVGIGTFLPIATLQVGGDVSASSYTSSLDNQVGFLGTASWAQNATTASYANQAGAVDYSNVTNKPTLVSASSQISYTGLSNVPAGIVSSSTQVTSLLPAGTVSSSGQVSYTGLSNIPSGILSSSTQINALSGVSASYAATASLLLGSVTSASFATTAATASSFSGSLQVVGLAEFSEGLVVSGGLYVSASDTTAVNKVLVLNTSTGQVFTTASVGTGGGGSGNGFPFSGSALITGSLLISGSGLRVTGSADITGAFTAQTKSFKIRHQTQPGKHLIYGVLEGPEHAIYARGRLKNDTIIRLPEEWSWLVDLDSITVHLTPIGNHQKLYVDGVYGTKIVIGYDHFFPTEIDCFYTVIGTRKDVAPLQTVE